MLSKIKKEVDEIISDTLNETHYNIEILESKLKNFHNLIDKAEKLSDIKTDYLDKEKISLKEPQTKSSVNENNEFLSFENTVKEKDIFHANQLKKNLILESFSWLGKKVSSMVSKNLNDHNVEKINEIHSSEQYQSFHYRSDEDVFDVLQEKKNDQFSDFDKIYFEQNNEKKLQKDDISIKPLTSLRQISDNSSKIEKVLHLLKHNYSYEEISETLKINEKDISMIKKFKLNE